jgi:hypothetical protein
MESVQSSNEQPICFELFDWFLEAYVGLACSAKSMLR